MSDFCCRVFPLSHEIDSAKLYGALCGVIPSYYACGQGFSNGRLRFLLEGGIKAELRLTTGRCEIWLHGCSAEQKPAYAMVYGPLFENLVCSLAGDEKEGTPYAGR